MAARLEWKGYALLLGEIRLAFVKRTAEYWRYAIPIGAEMMVNWSFGYQADNDARQDCESEVRRLLLDAEVSHIAALETERDAALADNAAFLEAVNGVLNYLHCHTADMGGNHRYNLSQGHGPKVARLQHIATQPHPGAAMLEEHRRAQGLLDRIHPGVRELLSEHDASHRFHWSVRCITCAPRNARERAMKEPEQCTDASCAKCRSGEPCH